MIQQPVIREGGVLCEKERSDGTSNRLCSGDKTIGPGAVVVIHIFFPVATTAHSLVLIIDSDSQQPIACLPQHSRRANKTRCINLVVIPCDGLIGVCACVSVVRVGVVVRETCAHKILRCCSNSLCRFQQTIVRG